MTDTPEAETNEEPARLGIARPSLVTSVTTAMGVVPVFLLGGLAVLIAEDLGFTERDLGFAVAGFFTVSALAAPPAGRISDRLGARRTLWLGVAASTTSMLGIGLFAHTWSLLVAFLLLGGLSNALSNLSGNVLLMGAADRRRLAMGFAIKQSAIPFTNLIAGLSVPVIGLTLGWRAAFVLPAALILVMFVPLPAVRAPAIRTSQTPSTDPDVDRIGLVLLATAAAAGTGAAGAAATFLVPSAAASGMSPGTAGLYLALAGVVGVAGRLFFGWAADRFDIDGLRVAFVLTFGASAGLLLMATGPVGGLMALATFVVFLGGWGWSGIFTFTIARAYASSAGRATGITQSGIFTGGVLGPALFGIAVDVWSFAAAWRLIAGMALLGACLLIVGRARLHRHQRLLEGR